MLAGAQFPTYILYVIGPCALLTNHSPSCPRRHFFYWQHPLINTCRMLFACSLQRRTASIWSHIQHYFARRFICCATKSITHYIRTRTSWMKSVSSYWGIQPITLKGRFIRHSAVAACATGCLIYVYRAIGALEHWVDTYPALIPDIREHWAQAGGCRSGLS